MKCDCAEAFVSSRIIASFILATEYGDESMNDAKNVLQTISSFMSSATAYVKGQLTCDAIREDVLWER